MNEHSAREMLGPNPTFMEPAKLAPPSLTGMERPGEARQVLPTKVNDTAAEAADIADEERRDGHEKGRIRQHPAGVPQ